MVMSVVIVHHGSSQGRVEGIVDQASCAQSCARYARTGRSDESSSDRQIGLGSDGQAPSRCCEVLLPADATTWQTPKQVPGPGPAALATAAYYTIALEVKTNRHLRACVGCFAQSAGPVLLLRVAVCSTNGSLSTVRDQGSQL